MADIQAPTPLTSDRLRSAHGFFTRQGGVSKGAYASLQCGFGAAGDERESVAENRARVAAAIGVPADRLTTPYQTHSTKVAIVTEPWAPEGAPEADALVCDRPDIAIGVLTADCAPCLFEDAEAGVVGAAHGGWRGAFDGVLEETVAAMESLGARRQRIRMAIGPTIGPTDYEVGPEFIQRFLDADESHRAFFSHPDDRGHAHFDLPAYLIVRARDAGLADAVWIGVSTLSEEEICFSYRRAQKRGEKDYGRMISVIRASGRGAR